MTELPSYNIRWSRFLYHYTTAETAAKYILPSGTLRFGSLKNTNDPREFLDWQISLKRVTNKKNWTFSSYGNVNMLQEPVNRLCRRNAKLACFTMDYLLDSGPEHSIRGFERPRMWAQYGNRFSGVCLCFRKDILINQFLDHYSGNEKIDANKIDYIPFNASMEDCICIDDHPTLEKNDCDLQQYLMNHIWDKRKGVYFEKLSDWSGEAEFRIAAITNSEDPDYISYGSSLVAVVLGPEIPLPESRYIVSYANDNCINVKLLSWQTGAPKLVHLAGNEEFINENNPCSHYHFF